MGNERIPFPVHQVIIGILFGYDPDPLLEDPDGNIYTVSYHDSPNNHREEQTHA